MILHFYFARRFLFALMAIAALLLSLIGLIDLVDLQRDFTGADVSFFDVLGLTLLRAPGQIDNILPLVVLLATIALFIGLARTSEMVVTRAAGRSALRALVAPVGTTLIIGALAVAVLGPIVAASTGRFNTLAESYQVGGAAALSVSSEGLWLRQGSATGQTVIRAERSNADASVLYDVMFIEYSSDGGPVRRIEAASAQLMDGAWNLKDAKTWPLIKGMNAEANAERFETLSLASTLTMDRIRERLGSASGVSIWDMKPFIAQLEQAGFSARRHQVWFQAELARPLFLMAMVMVGAAFTMRHTRLGGTGPAVLSAVLLGFALYFVRRFGLILGENGQLSVMLATWAVPVAGNLFALGILLHMEDG